MNDWLVREHLFFCPLHSWLWRLDRCSAFSSGLRLIFPLLYVLPITSCSFRHQSWNPDPSMDSVLRMLKRSACPTGGSAILYFAPLLRILIFLAMDCKSENIGNSIPDIAGVGVSSTVTLIDLIYAYSFQDHFSLCHSGRSVFGNCRYWLLRNFACKMEAIWCLGQSDRWEQSGNETNSVLPFTETRTYGKGSSINQRSPDFQR